MSDDMLEMLRDIQESARPHNMTFAEWSKEQTELRKQGGRNMVPGAWNGSMTGALGTSSRAPAGSPYRPSGNQGVGYNGRQQPQYGVPSGAEWSGNSQYRTVRPNQPSPWIDDVDMESIWYSPFEPVWPFGPPYYTRPREWNFEVGYNLNYIPQRMALNQMLRGMRKSWGVLSTVETTRMDQLLRIPWTIQRKERPRTTSKTVDQMRRFFKRPDGKSSFAQWTRRLLFDSFDIDFPVLYVDRGQGSNGPVKYVEVMDGGTFFPLIDDMGRRPDSVFETSESGIVYERRQPAFQQIIYGLPMVNLSEDEIINPIIRPQPDMPMFGYSPVEQCFTEITEAIRKTFYQLEFWRSGSMPELIITVPESWTPRQIATFQAHFDALLSGQLTLKSKVRFVPSGMKPFDIKNASGESLWSQRDELLVRLICYAFSVPPTPFIRQMNRSTAQNAQQQAQEEGLYPLMAWFKDDIMDRIIQEVFGYEDIEFVFLPRPEVDQQKQAEIHQIQIDNGLRSRNEIRAELGEEPIPDGDVLTIKNSMGAVPLKLVVEGKTLAPGTPGAPTPEGGKPLPKPQATQANPQRGPARNPTSTTPTPVHKAAAGDMEQADAEAQGNLPDYSHVQLKNGNYPKGHVWLQGLNVSIENAPGSLRGEKDHRGVLWQVKMPTSYGYIRGTIGADGDAVDIYVGPNPESETAWVIDQDVISPKGKNKGFDEHKVMFGYDDLESALVDYLLTHFDNFGRERIRRVVKLSVDDLKRWLAQGDLKTPLGKQNFGTVVLKQKHFWKFAKVDTISTATNLLWHDQTSAGRKPRKPTKKARKRKQGPRWLQLTAGSALVVFSLFVGNAHAQALQHETDLGQAISTVQNCVPADAGRYALYIENPLGNTGNLCYSFGTASCGASNTTVLAPGQSSWWPYPNAPTGPITCIASTGSVNATIRSYKP